MSEPNADASAMTVPKRRLAQRTFVVVGIATLAVALVALLWYARYVFLLAFAGVVFGVFLKMLSEPLSRYTPLSYRWSLMIIVLILILLVGLASWGFTHVLVDQFDQLAQLVPKSTTQAQNYLQQYEWGRWILNQKPQSSGGGMLRQASSIATSVLNFVAGIVVILFVGIYVAADPKLYADGIVRLVSPPHRKRAREVIETLDRALRWWLIGKICSMLVVGLLIWLGLSLIGVRLALALAVLAALLEIIPNLGPTLAAIPALLVAATGGTTQIIWVLVLYVAVQTIESYLLLPLVEQRSVTIPPALNIVVVVLLGMIAGVIGVLVAGPLTAVLLVLVRMLYVQDTLGDESIPALGEE